MKNKLQKLLSFITISRIGIFLFILMTSHTTRTYNYDGLIVITHPSNKTKEVSKKVFEKIIFGEKQSWPTGGVVYIALLKSSNSVGLKVVKDIFGMSANEFNKYWLGLSFEGKCKAPNFCKSEDDVINYVSSTPGAVGVVSTSTDVSKVSVLKINK